MPQGTQTLSLDYGANNRLVQASKDSQVVGSYVYDAHGLRAQKVASMETRQFVYDPSAHLLGDYVPATGEQREYVWMNGVLVATLDTADQSADIHYVGTDFLGTPRSVVDTQGQTVWNWDYADEPFGDSTPTGAYSLALRFPGQYHDTESGLNYNVHRDYSSATGRYVESDPAGISAGTSTYAYVDSNSMNWTDSVGFAKDKEKYRWAQCSQRDLQLCESTCAPRRVESCRRRWILGTEVTGGEVVNGWRPAPNGLSCNCEESFCEKHPATCASGAIGIAILVFLGRTAAVCAASIVGG